MSPITQVLENKIAIITGSGRGIGATTAQLFARQGAKVILTSRNPNELEEVANKIEQERGPGRTLLFTGDISDETFVTNMFSEIEKRWAPIQILVNNAAIVEVADFMNLKTETWDDILRINLRGPFLCSREAFRHMEKSKQGGCIVNLSSLGGIKGTEKFPGLSAYVVSKHGVVGLTESLAVEGKKYNIRVNCVAPGAVDTALLKKAAPFLKTKTTPEDIAKVILFLCDDNQSKSVTGSIIEIHSNE